MLIIKIKLKLIMSVIILLCKNIKYALLINIILKSLILITNFFFFFYADVDNSFSYYKY